jgi:hypothetical protein
MPPAEDGRGGQRGPDRLRGRSMPRRHTAHTISALASKISRGSAFEAQVKENGAAQLLMLLRAHLRLDIGEAHYTDLSDVAGDESQELRHIRTRQLLASADRGHGTMFDHPLLRLDVGGRHAYLEPDLIVAHNGA